MKGNKNTFFWRCQMLGISEDCGCLLSPSWYIWLLSLNHLFLTTNRWIKYSFLLPIKREFCLPAVATWSSIGWLVPCLKQQSPAFFQFALGNKPIHQVRNIMSTGKMFYKYFHFPSNFTNIKSHFFQQWINTQHTSLKREKSMILHKIFIIISSDLRLETALTRITGKKWNIKINFISYFSQIFSN